MASGDEGSEPGGRLVPLPRRRLGDDDFDGAELLAGAPTGAVADLLERTDHLLTQLELDIASLKDDQAKERARIERENEQRQQEADAAIEQLMVLAGRARQIAVHKARTDVLDAALDRDVPLDTSVSFGELVRHIEEEIRLAKGITGAIRLVTIGDLLKQATLRVEHMTRQAAAARARFLEETEVELRTEGKEARASYEIGMSVVRRDLKALDLALPPPGLDWDDHRWQHWDDWDPLSGVARWIRLGTYYRPQLEKFRFPALIELPGERGVLVDVAAGDRDVAVDAVRSLLVRVLAAFPPGATRFTFVDPAALGESVAPFLPLGEYRGDLVDGGVLTAEEQIEAKLVELTRHLERVIQQHLRGDYATLQQHNDAVGEVVEPYRFLVVFDFPDRLSERARQLLRNIVDNGPRCGVYTIMTSAPGAARANGARWRAMTAGVDRVVGDPDGYWFDSPVAGRWAVDLDRPPELVVHDGEGELTLFGQVLTTVGEQARAGQAAEVSHGRLFELLTAALRLRVRDDLPDLRGEVDADDPATWWQGSSVRGVGAPIGRTTARDVAVLWLDSSAASGALLGGDPAEAAALLDQVVFGLALLYPPDELALHLLGQGGATFRSYADERLPHARVIATDAERTFGVSVLDSLVREMTRRAMLVAPHGGERAGIVGYRDATGDVLPRIVLAVDGLERLVGGGDREAEVAAGLLDTLTRQGGSYGIHVVATLAADADLDPVAQAAVERLRVRVATGGDGDGVRRLLGWDDAGPSLDDRDAVLARVEGDPEAAVVFRGADLDPHDRDVALRDLDRLAGDRHVARRLLVHDGRAPARLEDADVGRLADGAAPARARLQPRLWLGQPVALGGPVEIALRRAPGANLLVVGRDEHLGQGVLAAALISAALGQGPDLEAVVLDLMGLEAGFGEVALALAERSAISVHRRRTATEALAGVTAELERRLAADEFRAPPLLLVVNGLGVGPASAPDDSVPLAAVAQLARLGPEVGVHVLCWADERASLLAAVGRDAAAPFALRLVQAMPAEESALLIDSALAASLGSHQGLLYDEEASRLTRLRPFRLPSVELARSLAEELGARRRQPVNA